MLNSLAQWSFYCRLVVVRFGFGPYTEVAIKVCSYRAAVLIVLT